MNKFLFTLCLALTLTATAKAQNQKVIDSLKNELPKTTDTTRVKLLISLCLEYRDAYPESALKYGKQALNLAKKLDFGIGMVDSYIQLGIVHERQGEFQLAIEYFQQGVKISRAINDQIGEQNLLMHIGIAYKEQSEYQQALPYYFKAVEICKKIKHERGLASNYNNIATIYRNQRKYVDAFKYYLKALEIHNKSDNKYGLMITFNGLALLQKEQNNTVKALEYYEKALEMAELLKNQVGIAGISTNLGELHEATGNYQQSLIYNQNALKIHQRLGFKNNVANNLNNLGSICHKQQQYDESLIYYNRAIAILEEKGSKTTLVESHLHIALVYLEQQRIQPAREHTDKGLQLALKIPSLEAMKEGYTLLARVYQNLGDFEKAYGYQQHLIVVTDSIFDLEKSRQLTELQTLYESEKKEKEIALLEKQKEASRFKFIITSGGLSFLLLVGFLLILLQRFKIKKNKKLMAVQQENAALRTRDLQRKLAFKNKELTTQSLNLVQKNGIMEELKFGINEIIEVSDKPVTKKINSLKRLIDYSFHLDKDWDRFKIHFEQVHHCFFERLKAAFPDLTAAECRLCALIKLNLTTKEMATIMGIAPESMKVARHRLRKKMGLSPKANLAETLISFDTPE